MGHIFQTFAELRVQIFLTKMARPRPKFGLVYPPRHISLKPKQRGPSLTSFQDLDAHTLFLSFCTIQGRKPKYSIIAMSNDFLIRQKEFDSSVFPFPSCVEIDISILACQ